MINLKDENTFWRSFSKRNIKNSLKKLKNAKVGIAGCGGIGSNLAMLLVRSGVFIWLNTAIK